MTGLEKPDIYHQKIFNQVSFPWSGVIQTEQVIGSGCMIKGKMIATLVCTGLDLFNKLSVERCKAERKLSLWGLTLQHELRWRSVGNPSFGGNKQLFWTCGEARELEFGRLNCINFALGVKYVNLPLSGRNHDESFTELLRIYL